ncbi:FAD-dependent monooxygenase [Kutzneria sp. NPDC051319]|uniref:FAD-dependent monooxygenase n=1 Tax=Kutzneria sp. NPDC051319 TaxID=3155047 RepID=UPI0034433474
MDQNAVPDYDVVVAGGGPVGLMLAAELQLAGVRSLVLERLTDRAELPDGVRGMHARTLETLDRRGMLEQFMNASDRPAPAGKHRVMSGTHFAGLTLLELGTLDSDHPYALVNTRERIEQLLEQRAVELGAEIRTGHEVIGLRQHDDGVTIDVDGPSGVHQLTTRYLVGCDGGRSKVRKAAGIPFPGNDPTVTAYVGRATIVEPHDLPTGWQRTPGGAMLRGGAGSGILLIEFDGAPADRDIPVTLADFQASFRRVTGTGLTLTDPQHLRRFTDNSRQADGYVHGRVLLAGDAAHVHAPFGGQGLNLGLQDAVNLGWKLAAAVQGWAPDGLLDSYSDERHPVAARVLHNTRAQVALMNPDPRVTPLREMFAELMLLDETNRYLTELITCVNVRYDVGSDEQRPHPLLGAFAPNLALKTENGQTTLAKLLRAGKALLLDIAGRPDLRSTGAGWADRVQIVTAHCERSLAAEALLVRPDGYVAWVAPTAAHPQDDQRTLRSALRTWFGTARA